MSLEKTDALVIRLADFSETSRVVTFFSRDWGKITTVAKGGRRLKGPFDAALDLLTTCRIVFVRKSSTSLDILTESQLVNRFRPPKQNLECLYGGYYVAELLSGLTEDYDPHPFLYKASLEALDGLATGDNLWLNIVRFELMVLHEIGQLPSLDVCVVCGTPLEGQNQLSYWVSQGGLICQQCQRQEFNQSRINAGTVAVWNRLSDPMSSAWQRVVLSPQQLKEMRSLLTAGISNALGRRPQMLRYLKTP